MDATLTEAINDYYKRAMQSRAWRHLDKIGFINVGYWEGVDDSMEIAQINLIETLVRFLRNREGNILDVACGKGASSKFLTKYFDPRGITGINISEQQLEFCRMTAPECAFDLMDATQLEFADAAFDNVLCIEACLHFMTRQKFFQEAYRVLRPGGRMAMLDFLCDYDLLEEDRAARLPRENYLPSLDAYREKLVAAGFKYVRVDDCTDKTIKAAADYMIRRMESEFDKSPDADVLQDITRTKRLAQSLFSGALVYAIK